ncbi:DUF3710 domain-containing protein [Corynebacterium macclintockiae]|uniref:DUF3710 domain-containing protein n=1 Tax=Corynebacterium macclintockiae TaxID=2913501 RepID=UPI00255017C1|nr:DUF3710 domain-containing protein [Corynebacterium macclintockiae]MDK8869191.1 DUF3710 domain-containing protein [Corynebacterium macclintockiae]
MMFGRKKKDSNPAEEMEQVVAEQGQEDNDFGPFDGDTVNFEDFDFSDFSAGALDLGSMLIPVPHGGGVTVEMGPEGPQMIHLQVDGGRLTPVAFAAPRNGDLWAETIDETVAGMTKDGLEVHLEDGPWGQEICAVAGEGQMRIIGANGPRWMFRMTLAGEKSKAEDLALIAREIIARTFIRRGNDPIPAGQALPVLMPPPLQEQMEQQLRQMEAEQNGGEQQ